MIPLMDETISFRDECLDVSAHDVCRQLELLFGGSCKDNWIHLQWCLQSSAEDTLQGRRPAAS